MVNPDLVVMSSRRVIWRHHVPFLWAWPLYKDLPLKLTSLKCGSRVGSRKPHIFEITTITRLIMITEGTCINSSNDPVFFSTLRAISKQRQQYEMTCPYVLFRVSPLIWLQFFISPNTRFLTGLYCIGILHSLLSPSHGPCSMLATQATH